MALPVLTASNEPFFIFKTYENLLTTDDHLNDLLVIAVEGYEASQVDL